MLAAMLFTAAATMAAKDAGASPSARLVYVRAQGALSCGDEQALRKAVTSRFGYDPFFAWAARTVVVEMARSDGRYRSRVQVVDEQGVAHGTREIAAEPDSCASLIDLTALAISIALDASIASSPPPTPPPPAAPPPVPPAPPPPSPPTPSAAPSPALASAASRDVVVAPRSRSPLPSHPAALGGFVGADVLASTGSAPSPSAGLALFGGVRTYLFSGALEIRADAPAGAESPGGGSAASWLVMGGLVPCVRFAWASFCAVGELGSLQARGYGLSTAQGRSTFVAFAGARAGVDLGLSTTFSLRAHVDGLVDLHRPSLTLGSSTVWNAPAVAGSVGVGLVARIL
jgi:hypothetical protein